MLIDILASVHEAVLASRSDLADSEPMNQARGIIRSFRLTSFSGGINILGTGIEAGQQAAYVQPVDAALLSEAWRRLLEIATLACGRNGGNKGIVIHINNIENLSKDEEIEEAARTFRDLRDLFLAPYLHWLVVGTSDASFKLLGAYPQVRSVFLPSHPALRPLTIDEFMKLIHARYQHLMLKNRHLIPPVEDEAAARIYELFQGDLRGALRTLEQGCLALAGITEGDPVRPLRYDEIIRTLQPIYAAEMLAELSETMIQRMRSIAAIRKEGITQRQLQKLWSVTHQRVSQIVARLEQQGFLQQVGTRGRSKFYALTGAGAIALGIADA